MAITIPSGDNKKAFDDVMDALGGDDYSYYLFDIKNVEDKDSTKKVQIALKVYVDSNSRIKAVQNIREALLKKYEEIPVNAKGTSLDVPIPNKPKNQVIRIEVKPEGSKGSGGGAKATAIQEGAQCVYTAMRYYCGDIEHITEDDLKCGMKYTSAPGLKLEDVMGLPSEWKEGSWAGANEIFDKIGAGKYIFVRGDNMVEKQLSEAFKRVKDQTNLSSEDKWNPSDIWMVKAGMRRKVAAKLKKEETIDCLNNYLQQALADGDLIGISLQKIQGNVVRTLLKNAGFNVTKLTEPKFADCKPGKGNGKDKITDDIYDLLDKFNAKNFTANKRTYNIIAYRPKAWRYSKLAGLRMLKWLNSPGVDADRAMKELYLYASSQSDKSSVYWKLS